MPIVTADGIDTYYEVHGRGRPVLMMAPGGFDATVEKWSASGVWKSMRPLETLSHKWEMIAYDRRESGQSGGRLEVVSWDVYAAQAKGLLDATDHDQAVIMGGCMGCSVALAFAARYPDACEALILHWPVGGYQWSEMGKRRFDAHLDELAKSGISGIASGLGADASFWSEPAAGPWARCIARDEAFRNGLLTSDPERYLALVTCSREALFDALFPTGAAPVELPGIKVPTLIIPGGDEVHTRSAAYALAELLPAAELQDIPFPEQTADHVRDVLTGFVDSMESRQ